MLDGEWQQKQLTAAVDDHAGKQEAAGDGQIRRAEHSDPNASRDDSGAF